MFHLCMFGLTALFLPSRVDPMRASALCFALALLAWIGSGPLAAQSPGAPVGGGSGWTGGPDGPSAEQRAQIWTQLREAQAQLRAAGALPASAARDGGFALPIAPVPDASEPGAIAVTNFVDLDPTGPDDLLDYACGARSYDLANGYDHAGIDYFPWPFPWTSMDSDQTEIRAAADGVILLKQDGFQDRSCSFNGSQWNAVYLQHANGAVTWYGHLKRHSLTAKNVGDAVTAGEVLGVVGSSGNSTGPHLHFEVYDAEGTLVEPHAGACNPDVEASWWAEQEPYHVSSLAALYTHGAAPGFPTCPSTDEQPNRQDAFEPGDRVYLAAYYRDQLETQVTSYRVRHPAGTVAWQWTHSSNAPHYPASYWFWVIDLPTDAPRGTWTFEADYEERAMAYPFQVGVSTAIEVGSPAAHHLSAPSPNPFDQQATFALTVGQAQAVRAVATDVLGREVAVLFDGVARPGVSESLVLEAGGLAPGLYLVTVTGETFQSTRRVTRAR